MSKASKPSPIPGVSNQGTYTELFYLNHNESVVGTTDDPLLNQPLKTKNGYYPYGTIEYSEGTSYNPLKFAGSYYEPTPNSYESPPVDQMYSMGTRMYDTTTCRFLTADIWGPGVLSDPWTLHSYHYCKNDPVNRVDPWGLNPTKKTCNELACDLEREADEMIKNLTEVKREMCYFRDANFVSCTIAVVSLGAAIAGLFATLGGSAVGYVLASKVVAISSLGLAALSFLIACLNLIFGTEYTWKGLEKSLTDAADSCRTICKILDEMRNRDPKECSAQAKAYMNFNWGVCKSEACDEKKRSTNQLKEDFKNSPRYVDNLMQLRQRSGSSCK